MIELGCKSHFWEAVFKENRKVVLGYQCCFCGEKVILDAKGRAGIKKWISEMVGE